MTLPRFDYARPTTLEQALDILHSRDSQVKILAGGTDLVVSLQQKLFTPKVVLDIKGLSELRGNSSSSKPCASPDRSRRRPAPPSTVATCWDGSSSRAYRLS